MVPVGVGFHAGAGHRDGLAVDAEQALDDPLGFLVAPFAEVVVADDPVSVDEVQGRPVVVVERRPDRVVVVNCDRVVDRAVPRCLAHPVDLVLERELGRVDADHDEAVVAVGPRPGADVWLGAQPVNAGQGPEVDENDLAAQPGGAERPGVQPLSGAAE